MKDFALVYKTLIKKLMYLLAGLSALKKRINFGWLEVGGGVEKNEETNIYLYPSIEVITLCFHCFDVHNYSGCHTG